MKFRHEAEPLTLPLSVTPSSRAHCFAISSHFLSAFGVFACEQLLMDNLHKQTCHEYVKSVGKSQYLFPLYVGKQSKRGLDANHYITVPPGALVNFMSFIILFDQWLRMELLAWISAGCVCLLAPEAAEPVADRFPYCSRQLFVVVAVSFSLWECHHIHPVHNTANI